MGSTSTNNAARQSRTRVAAKLPDHLNKELYGYTQAAETTSRSTLSVTDVVAIGAVGLGVLALPQLTEARVIFTPANQPINENNRRLQIDFNHDGIADASLYIIGYCRSGSGFRECYGTFQANGLQGNEVMMSNQGKFAAADMMDRIIGPKDNFQLTPKMASCRSGYNAISHTSFRTSNGPWRNVTRYLGFKFDENGQTHYGWARMTTEGFPCFPSGTLTGYAYETVPNRPIPAGTRIAGAEALNAPSQDAKPAEAAPSSPGGATLGALAAGAMAIEKGAVGAGH